MHRQAAFITAFIVAVFVIGAMPVRAEEKPYCLCTDDITKITAENYQTTANTVISTGCVEDRPVTYAPGKSLPSGCNVDIIKRPDGQKYAKCEQFKNTTACEDGADKWLKQKELRLKSAGKTDAGTKGTIAGIIPDCVLQDNLERECRDIGIFVVLLINFGRINLSIIGAFALAYFVYGGFKLILSQGNPEKIKSGTDTMLAALIGIFVAFAGYFLIRFLGEAVGVQEQFRLF